MNKASKKTSYGKYWLSRYNARLDCTNEVRTEKKSQKLYLRASAKKHQEQSKKPSLDWFYNPAIMSNHRVKNYEQE